MFASHWLRRHLSSRLWGFDKTTDLQQSALGRLTRFCVGLKFLFPGFTLSIGLRLVFCSVKNVFCCLSLLTRVSASGPRCRGTVFSEVNLGSPWQPTLF